MYQNIARGGGLHTKIHKLRESAYKQRLAVRNYFNSAQYVSKVVINSFLIYYTAIKHY